ncbi:MAG: alpha/beta hydrolase [Chitinophagaceae bacterium]
MLQTLKASNGYEMSYQKIGSGDSIILLHGFGEDSTIWEYQVDVLKQKFTVLIPDLPGCGQSKEEIQTISLHSISIMLKELLDKESIKQTILFGHSMGGYIAMDFAKNFASYLKGISLVFSNAYADSDDKKDRRKKSIHLIEQGGKEAFLHAMILNLYSERSKKEIKLLIQQHLTIAKQISSNTLIAYYNAMLQRQDNSYILNDLQIPVQFILGKEDSTFDYKYALKQIPLCSQSDVHLLNEVGHTGMYERPDLLNNALLDFASRIYLNNIH